MKTSTISTKKLVCGEWEEVKQEVIEAEGELENCKIGHDQISETKAVNFITHQASGLTFADTPGFNDTGGAEMDISNAVGVSFTINKCRNIVPVLLVPVPAISDIRSGLRPSRNCCPPSLKISTSVSTTSTFGSPKLEAI